jgi:hypothetical protein
MLERESEVIAWRRSKARFNRWLVNATMARLVWGL